MRFTTIISSAVCLYSAAVSASVDALTVPSLIKSGEEFIANFTYPISQPRIQAIIWGLGPDSALPGQVGGWGHVGVTKLDWSSVDISGSVYYYQILHGLKIPSGNTGPRALQAVLVGYVGAAGNTVFETRYFSINTTTTGATSNDVHVSDITANRRSITWPTS